MKNLSAGYRLEGLGINKGLEAICIVDQCSTVPDDQLLYSVRMHPLNKLGDREGVYGFPSCRKHALTPGVTDYELDLA